MQGHRNLCKAGSALASPSNASGDRTTGAVFGGTESLLTQRWRGLDSNFQYAGAVNLIVTPLWHESQVVIRVEELSKEEREQILYNHIRLGTQTKKVKRELKPFLPTAARIHFPPRRVERI
jgi:hypothetical protein